MQICASLLCFLLLSVPASAQKSQPVRQTPTGQSLVRKTYSQVLIFIANTYKVNIVSDSMPNDDTNATIADSVWRGDTADASLRGIAKWRSRNVVLRDGIYILSHMRKAAMYKQFPPNVLSALPSGTLTVRRRGDTDGEVSLLPARLVSVKATAVPCAKLASTLRTEAAINVRAVPGISARKVNVYATDVSPITLLGCVAEALNAGPEIVLAPSPEQIADENLDSLGLPDEFKKRIDPSNKLRAEVEKLLTKEQRDEIAKGEVVEISLGSLPESLQKQARDYVALATKLNTDLIPHPDSSQWQQFQLRFKPQSDALLWYLLGVTTIGPDGSEYAF